MSLPASPTALIAEDEPLLAQALRAELARAWPELQVLASVGDGVSAMREALALQPDVLFFDIRMPGMNGLEAAAALADEWPMASSPGSVDKPYPLLVFVTAYDEYAVRAFEQQAVDYVLKPVQPQRVKVCVARLQAQLRARQQATILTTETLADTDTATATRADGTVTDFDATMSQLRALLHSSSASAAPPTAQTRTAQTLTVLQAAGVGKDSATLHMVPVSEVLYFEAADKYVRVVTAQAEYLLRTPLKDLSAQLDASVFWQIHRGTLVRASAIAAAHRSDAAKLWVSLRGRSERLAVSRLYAHQFRAM